MSQLCGLRLVGQGPNRPAHAAGLEADLETVLDRAADDLRALHGSRVLLTGGTGFVGSWLLEVLAWSADRLGTTPRAVVLTRDPARFRSRRPHLGAHRIVDLVAGDVRRSPQIPGPIDFAVAGASANLIGHRDAQDQEVWDTQIRGAEIARHCLDHHHSRVLLLSSGAARQSSRATYAEAKRQAERIVVDPPGSEQAIIARLFTFVGPYLPLEENFAVGNFLADVLAGRAIAVKGDGTSIRSYLYSADLAWWLWALLVRGVPGRLYEVGSPEPVAIGSLAARVGALSDPPAPVHVAGSDIPAAAGSVYVPELSAVRSLGLEVTWNLEQALQRTFDWHRSGGPTATPTSANA